MAQTKMYKTIYLRCMVCDERLEAQVEVQNHDLVIAKKGRLAKWLKKHEDTCRIMQDTYAEYYFSLEDNATSNT